MVGLGLLVWGGGGFGTVGVGRWRVWDCWCGEVVGLGLLVWGGGEFGTVGVGRW